MVVTDPHLSFFTPTFQPLKGVPQRDPSAPCGARDSRSRHPAQVLLQSTTPQYIPLLYLLSHFLFSLFYPLLHYIFSSILLSSLPLTSLLYHLSPCAFSPLYILPHFGTYCYRILKSSLTCSLAFTSHVSCEVAEHDTYHISHII